VRLDLEGPKHVSHYQWMAARRVHHHCCQHRGQLAVPNDHEDREDQTVVPSLAWRRGERKLGANRYAHNVRSRFERSPSTIQADSNWACTFRTGLPNKVHKSIGVVAGIVVVVVASVFKGD